MYSPISSSRDGVIRVLKVMVVVAANVWTKFGVRRLWHRHRTCKRYVPLALELRKFFAMCTKASTKATKALRKTVQLL